VHDAGAGVEGHVVAEIDGRGPVEERVAERDALVARVKGIGYPDAYPVSN